MKMRARNLMFYTLLVKYFT